MSILTKQREIYLDYASATPLDRLVAREMKRGAALYGNPSSFNDAGRIATEELSRSRGIIAQFLGSHKDEVIFTSSGTESNSLAIEGSFLCTPEKKKKILTTSIEHLSVLKSIEYLSKNGADVVYLPVDARGRVYAIDVERILSSSVFLVSIMYANNEIGTIEPIRQIARVIHNFRKSSGSCYPLLHTDACQATEYLDMNVHQLGVDLLSFNGTKIYGPRGAGALYVRRGTPIEPLLRGGGQEFGLRAGTENLPAIRGFAKAVQRISKDESRRMSLLRDYFIENLNKKLKDCIIVGENGENRLPNNILVCIAGVKSENVLIELDRYGVRASSGSACTAHSVEPSHVLKAVRISRKYIHGAIRFTLGRGTKRADIDYVLQVLPKIVNVLQKRYATV